MAKTPKLPPERYKKIAKELAKYSPEIRTISRKKTLTPTDKRKITAAENKAHKWTAGQQTLIPVSARDVKKLKDKDLLVPGFNAVVDRNVGKNPKAEVRDGRLVIKDNGRDINVIPVRTNNKERIAGIASDIFKGKKRRNVWIRFVNGRGDRGFADAKALLRYLVMIWEKYVPLWSRENVQIDEIIVGFEVYESGKGPSPKGPKPTRKPRKPSGGAPRKAIRKSIKKNLQKARKAVRKAVKSRLKAAPKKKPLPKVAKTKKFLPKKQAKLATVKKTKPRKPAKKTVPKTKRRGTIKNVRKAKKNRRH